MKLRNSPERYGAVAQLLHWSVVALVIVQFVLAQLAKNEPERSLGRFAMLTRHKWIGMSILMLVVLRLLWRWTNTVPAAPPGMPGWQIGAARLSHISLYALLIIQPLAGWMMSSAKALSVTWFGLFTFPDLVPPSQQTFELMHEIHEVCAMLILVLAALHVAAALKHHFVDHDDVLRRMLPMRLRRKG